LSLAEGESVAVIHIGRRDEGLIVSRVPYLKISWRFVANVAPAEPIFNSPTAGAAPSIAKPLTASRAGVLMVVLSLGRACQEQEDSEEKTEFHGDLPSLPHIVQKEELIENP
jgi:hypothetical protein